GENRSSVRVRIIRAVDLLQICRNQSGLMIVAVQNVGSGYSRFEKLHYRSLKENPTVRLSPIIFAAFRIEIHTGSIEKSVIAEKKNIDVGIWELSAMDIVRNAFESHCNAAIAWRRNRFEVEFLEIDHAMARNDDRYVDVQFLESCRKCSNDIGQSA